MPKKKFVARLLGRNEVPPVETNATGRLVMVLSEDRRSLFYRLEVNRLRRFISAHLHLGVRGVNGPIVAFLFGETIPGISVDHGVVRGTLTAKSLTDPLRGQSIADLVRLIKEGRIYVNAHTEQNPDGEIRGQVRAIRK
jgi:hypothetical protein